MENIKPTSKLEKPDDAYTLEDKDYLLIKAIQELTKAIKRRHQIIRELDNLDELIRKLTRMKASPKLRKLEHVEIQLPMQETLMIL